MAKWDLRGLQGTQVQRQYLEIIFKEKQNEQMN